MPAEDGVSHSLRLSVTDRVGNNAITGWETVIVDTVAPVLTVSTIAYHVELNQVSTLLAGLVSDGHSVAQVNVRINAPNGTTTVNPATVNAGSWSYDASIATNGIYRLFVEAFDEVGNVKVKGPFVLQAGSPYTANKQVSVDGGTTWFNADTSTGPTLLIGNDPQYRVIASHVGNVAITLDVTDPTVPALDVSVLRCRSAQSIWSSPGPFPAHRGSGQITNTASIEGVYTDFGGTVWNDNKTDDAYYYGIDPTHTIQKQVSVDGGATWHDADAPTGPTLLTGYDPQFRVIASHTGNVDILLDDRSDIADAQCDGCRPGSRRYRQGDCRADHGVVGRRAADQHRVTVDARTRRADRCCGVTVKRMLPVITVQILRIRPKAGLYR